MRRKADSIWSKRTCAFPLSSKRTSLSKFWDATSASSPTSVSGISASFLLFILSCTSFFISRRCVSISFISACVKTSLSGFAAVLVAGLSVFCTGLLTDLFSTFLTALFTVCLTSLTAFFITFSAFFTAFAFSAFLTAGLILFTIFLTAFFTASVLLLKMFP